MKRTILCLVTVLIFSSCNYNNTIERKIDNIFKEFQAENTPGVSVSILKKDSLLYQKSFGLSKLESNELIESKTNFRLASITKQFTAFSILLLEQQGKLSLNDRINKFFPNFPNYGKNITVKNILQHTSGLLDYENFVTGSAQLKDVDVLNILLMQDSLKFISGSRHEYSNSGYAILALIIEKVSGNSFATFLSEKIFLPLKMTETIAYEKGVSKVKNRAYGYTKSDSGFISSDQSLTSAILGDGGIYSSIVDLIKWNKEINNPTLLEKSKFLKIFEKGKNKEGIKFDYGFGWRLDPYNNFKRKYHTGQTCGFNNIYMKIPEHNLTIIILSNISNYNAKKAAEKVTDLLINNS